MPLSKKQLAEYETWGVPPPEVIDHNIRDEDLSAILERLAHEPHDWQQAGPDIFCEKGHHRHGFHTTQHILQGTNPDGTPNLKQIVAKPNMAVLD